MRKGLAYSYGLLVAGALWSAPQPVVLDLQAIQSLPTDLNIETRDQWGRLRLEIGKPVYIRFDVGKTVEVESDGTACERGQWYLARRSVDIRFVNLQSGDQAKLQVAAEEGRRNGAKDTTFYTTALERAPGEPKKPHLQVLLRAVPAAQPEAAPKTEAAPRRQRVGPTSGGWIAFIAILVAFVAGVAALLLVRQTQVRQEALNSELRKLRAALDELRPTDIDYSGGGRLEPWVARQELEQVTKRLDRLTTDVQALEARPSVPDTGPEIAALRTALENLKKTAEKRVDSSLVLLTQVLNEPSDTDSPLAAQLADSVTDFFRKAVPERDGALRERAARSQRLMAAVEACARELDEVSPGAGQAIGPATEETRRIDSDIRALLEANQGHRLKLDMQIEFSAAASSGDTVVKAMASGLRRQIIKFAEPVEYLDRRIGQAALQATAAAVDIADQKADTVRRHDAIQRTLRDLADVGGFTWILPQSGDRYSAEEHEVVRMLPPTDASASHTVERMTTRGLLQQGRVVRKARVILYQ